MRDTPTQVVVFRWEDACGKTTWDEKEQNPGTICALVSGILIEDSESVIIVGLERFDDGQWRETLTVPKRLVLGRIAVFSIPSPLRRAIRDQT